MDERQLQELRGSIALELDALISNLDYDLWKGIVYPEDGGPNWMPELIEEFIENVGL